MGGLHDPLLELTGRGPRVDVGVELWTETETESETESATRIGLGAAGQVITMASP